MLKRIKFYIKELLNTRLTVLIVLCTVMFMILINKIFLLQIVNGQRYLDDYKLLIQKKREIPGTRGKILDKNGNVLADNKLSYSVTIEDNGEFDNNRKEKNKLLNNTILKAINIVEENGDSVFLDFGVKLNEDGEFEFKDKPGMTRYRFIADVFGKLKIDDLKEKEKNISAKDLIKFLATNELAGYEVDMSMNKDDILKLVAIRYDMHLNSYQKYIPIIIADDVSDKTVAAIEEHKDTLVGINIGEDSRRYYPDGKYFSPLIGYTGKISRAEYDKKRQKNKEASLTDVIGKAGIEKRMDNVLEGKKGEDLLYVDNMGKIVESKKIKKSKAGDNLYLTIDKDLSIVAYNLLEQKMAGILLTRLTTDMTYTPDPEKSNNLIIPIGDLYYSLISNKVINMDMFSRSNAGSAESRIYSAEQKHLIKSIDLITTDLKNNSSKKYKDLSKPMQKYIHYIEYDFLMKKKGIIDASRIDMSDPVFKKWRKDGDTSFSAYLHHAIKENWIDTEKLISITSVESDYLDANEIYNGIIEYLGDALKTDSGFELCVYDSLIRDEKITGNDLALALFEQGVLTDEKLKQSLEDGMSSYDFFRSCIQNLLITPGMLGLEPCQGSIVLTDPNNGDVLACVSYPGFDNNKLANRMDNEYYFKLQKMASSPFFNKATQVVTAPGSTYKPITAVAGLMEGVINTETSVTCTGKFEKITPSPKCWVYPSSHGTLKLRNAIAHSCNVFFSEVGYRLGGGLEKGKYDSNKGIEKLDKYTKMFALGEKSGIELPESKPLISTEDAVRSAFGQGTHAYTTVGLAKYTQVLASRGDVYDLTVLKKLENVSGKTIKTYNNERKKELNVSPIVWDTVIGGMELMTTNSASFKRMKEANIKIAGKTGTAQESNVHGDHVLFIGFAPVNNPKISMALRISNGYLSPYMEQISDDILAYYMKKATKDELITGKADDITYVSRND